MKKIIGTVLLMAWCLLIFLIIFIIWGNLTDFITRLLMSDVVIIIVLHFLVSVYNWHEKEEARKEIERLKMELNDGKED